MDTNTFASPYACVGAKLIDNGFSAIPLLPGTKRPADLRWSQYCDNLPEDHKADAWSRMPNAGVGIACGFNGVVALDFDTDDPAIINAVESVVGESFIQKRGKRGFTGFYRASAPIESRGFNIHGSRVIDLLAEGRQCAIPPSIHPETDEPYTWITPLGLEDTLPEHLPLLPEDIDS
jgi:hypothetical protein